MKVIRTVVPIAVSYILSLTFMLFVYSQVLLSNAVEAYQSATEPKVEEVSKVELPSLTELYNEKLVTGEEVIECIQEGRATVTVVTNQGVQVDFTSETEIQPEFLAQLVGYNYLASVDGNSVVFIYQEG